MYVLHVYIYIYMYTSISLSLYIYVYARLLLSLLLSLSLSSLSSSLWLSLIVVLFWLLSLLLLFSSLSLFGNSVFRFAGRAKMRLMIETLMKLRVIETLLILELLKLLKLWNNEIENYWNCWNCWNYWNWELLKHDCEHWCLLITVVEITVQPVHQNREQPFQRFGFPLRGFDSSCFLWMLKSDVPQDKGKSPNFSTRGFLLRECMPRKWNGPPSAESEYNI